MRRRTRHAGRLIQSFRSETKGIPIDASPLAIVPHLVPISIYRPEGDGFQFAALKEGVGNSLHTAEGLLSRNGAALTLPRNALL